MILNDAIRELLDARRGVSRDLRNALPVEAIAAEDVSNAIAWLVSDEAKYVTGITLRGLGAARHRHPRRAARRHGRARRGLDHRGGAGHRRGPRRERAAAAGLTPEPGDALLIYQGRDRYEAADHVYLSGALAVRGPGIGEDGAKWNVAADPGLVLWDFYDARHKSAASLKVHGLIFAIGLCLVDNCLLGPAAAAPPAIHRSTGVLVNPLLL